MNHAHACIHVNVRYGRNLHHIVEAIFKATARALRAATAVGGRRAALHEGRPWIALLDYGAGNLRSVENALRAVGARRWR